MKLVRLILAPCDGAEDAPYLVANRAGQVVERGLLSVDGPPLGRADRTVAVVPGVDVLVRWLDLPAGSAAQQGAAALWALAGDLATPADRLVVALGRDAALGPRMVAVAARARLESWIDYLAAFGVRADAFIPDCLALPEAASEDELVSLTFGSLVALRGRAFAATVQPELVELVSSGRSVRPLEDPQAVEQALIAAAWSPSVSLTLPVSRDIRRGWRTAAALAAGVVLSPLAITFAAGARDHLAAVDLEKRAAAVAIEADPGLGRLPDPTAAYLDRASAAPPPGGPVAAAAALFTALEPIAGADLDIVVADAGAPLKATVGHSEFGDMRAVDATLRRHRMTAVETSTIEDGGRIVSDISVEGAR